MTQGNEAAAQAVDAVADAERDARRIGELLGIKTVVVVDDEYARAPTVGSVIAACQAQINAGQTASLLAIPELAQVPFGEDLVLWEPALREVWEVLDDVQRQRLVVSLTGPEAAASFGPLAEILKSFKPQFLSLAEWRAKAPELLKELSTASTLFLFDLDMSKEDGGRADEGMHIIADLLKTGSKIHFCGLLSHTIAVDAEYTDWTTYSDTHAIVEHRDRFVVISKRHLPESPVEFARRLKRAAITPHCNELKELVFNVLDTAHSEAKKKLKELNIYDFEQVVFESSHAEGVWEPETVLRIFGLYSQLDARDRLKKNAKVEEVASRIRSVVDFPFRPVDAPEPSSRAIYRLELYEDGDYLNSHHIPLDLGDIFRKTVGKREFVLLAQPCDIMCRVDKETRANEVYFAPILTLSQDKKPSDNPLAYCELEFYATEVGKVAYADFRNISTVCVDALDLSVLNADGSLSIKVGGVAPSSLIPAWQRRFTKLQEKAAQRVSRYEAIKAAGTLPGESEQLALQTLTGGTPGILKGTINLQQKTMSFDLKRVGRVKQPRAGMLLRRFTYYLARDAFEHDLTRVYNAQHR